MPFLAPPDDDRVTYEFFSPFAHVEGRFEWCRIRSPTHGVFDTFILIGLSPPVVYTNSAAGERFLRERWPEVETHHIPEDDLLITERDDGRVVAGMMRASVGPVELAEMTLAAPRDARPEAVPYGGEGKPVWGSKRFTCWGVDLALRGRAQGAVWWADGREERLEDEPAIVTLGSFGRIAPL
jgi:hypothetical protein